MEYQKKEFMTHIELFINDKMGRKQAMDCPLPALVRFDFDFLRKINIGERNVMFL